MNASKAGFSRWVTKALVATFALLCGGILAFPVNLKAQVAASSTNGQQIPAYPMNGMQPETQTDPSAQAWPDATGWEYGSGGAQANVPVTVPGSSQAGDWISQQGQQGQTWRPGVPPTEQPGTSQTDTNGSRRSLRLRPEPPTEFQLMVASTTGRRLRIFGASIFQGDVPSTFAPVSDVPVGPDYVIGPGDRLQVQVWGQLNQQGTFEVDRTGAISIPQVGTVHVAGLRFGELADTMRSELGRVYRNFHLNVTMGQLRTIQVFVVGQARQPGSYSISSMSTLLNGLFASGGPLPQGSLRDIQVKRGDRTIVHFDLYDLLLSGDKSKDVPLEPGDVIFIPAVGPQVAVAGSVHNPAIYELKTGSTTTLEDVLTLAGGRTNVAAGSEVRIDRIVDRSMLSIVDVALNKAESTPLEDGDIVSVTSIVDRFKNAVTLRGNVANPGRYVWHSGMRVSDLIPDKDALVTRNYWQHRNRLGQMPNDYQPEQTMSPNSQMGLQPEMQYPAPGQAGMGGAIPQQNNGRPEGALSVRSGVGSNGFEDRTGSARGTSASQGGSSVGTALTSTSNIFTAKNDVVLSAPDINWSYAVIERQSKQNLTTSLIPFSLGKLVLDGDQSQNLALEPGDVVTIFSTADMRVPTSQQTRFVRLEGEFNSAGVYSVEPGETLRHLLQRAGGFTPDAYLYASEFTRESTKRVEKQRLNEYADELEADISAQTAGANARALNAQDAAGATASQVEAQDAIARLRRVEPIGRIVLQLKPDSHGIGDVPDLQLEDGDRFVVPRVPSSVEVAGQVYSANAFVFERGRHVKDYVKQAGGPTRQADRRRTFVMRADGSVFSDQYGNVPKAKIFPGDTVVVPMKLSRAAVLRNIADISTIIGQLGLGIAALNLVGF